MYGVGHSLSGLSDFVGLRLCAVDDLENIVYFRFVNANGRQLEIGVEGEWIIRDPSQAVIARGTPRPNEPVPKPPIGSVVIIAKTQPPSAIVLRFESEYSIQIIDNSDQHESFCIPHANVYI